MLSYDTSAVVSQLEIDASVEALATATEKECTVNQDGRASSGPRRKHANSCYAGDVNYWAQLSVIAMSA